MKIYLAQTVLDAALERIRGLFDAFEHIVVNVSGGKDSTVVLNLALQVAEERGRLPQKVLFLDQEGEWQATIDHIRLIRADPRVNLDWLQVPCIIFNASSHRDTWLHCWWEGEQWIRDKEPDSIHENVYGTDRFTRLIDAYRQTTCPRPSCGLSGVRTEESPGRYMGLTTGETFEGRTWGSKHRAGDYTFYPIYDWGVTDVWKAIHDHGWAYNRLYDYMYQYGIPLNNMRVSNINHETALKSLTFLQEIEPDTWDKMTARLTGINTVGQLGGGFFKPTTLPPMFASWGEYRDHLLDNLIVDADIRAKMQHQFQLEENRYVESVQADLIRTEIAAILVNDYHLTKLLTWRGAHVQYLKNRGKISGRTAQRRT